MRGRLELCLLCPPFCLGLSTVPSPRMEGMSSPRERRNSRTAWNVSILKQCWGLCMCRPCLCTLQHILNESAGLLVESRSVQHLSSLPQPSILARWSMETRSFQASWLPTESPLQAPVCQTSSGLSRGVCVWMGVLAVCISDGVRGVLMSPDYAHIVLCVDQLVPLSQL